ncbi:hypothetical protein GGF46_000411 [Coemansia sp. RSA 552]|nr:hypothetical protein GGF46_000411 [Coemansia sp. RSA 552]
MLRCRLAPATLQRPRCWAPVGPGFLGARALSQLSASEIRQRYTDYFVRNGHVALASAPIVPRNDPTLLFTNAGMVPFKQHFLSPSTAPNKMVTSIQKCVRAGGKHNDLDQVGRTPRHHTFFEMLGNFSFGAYDKRAIIHMAWKFVREELQMPVEMLRVTVLETDAESYKIWKDEVGLDPRRIVRCGPKDNFWSMGDGEGPCGPCTEIFWDTKDPRYAEGDDERWLEFWNLVFMEYHRDASGRLVPLATPCIDTGMGLERVSAILQGKANNFDTDEFQIVIRDMDRHRRPATAAALDKDTELTYKHIIADHLRASAFLISEGVYPSNTGRGYVLRRIIRRAFRAGRLLGISDSVLPALYPSLEAEMGQAYPELTEHKTAIVDVLWAEENAFKKTLDRGLALLKRVFASTDRNDVAQVVSGADAFTLYDTHGFPVDLTQDIARDHGWTVDVDGFNTIQRQSRQRNKSSWKGKVSDGSSVANEVNSLALQWQEAGIRTRFCGYDLDPGLRAAQVDGSIVASSKLSNGDILVAVDPCPFYALGGGQEADAGSITVADSSGARGPCSFAVQRAVASPDKQTTVLHLSAATSEMKDVLATGSRVVSAVDMARRYGCAVHHTATHLLHAALRSVVGTTVKQAGSLVQPDALRFDFTSSPLDNSRLREVERLVNDMALGNTEIEVSEMLLDEAKAKGAIALFSEKYNADSVRVVKVPGMSMELCGGTHVRSTRAVYPFHITGEGSIGAGTRRIDAVAGVAASGWLQRQLAHGQAAARVLDVARLDGLARMAQQLTDKNTLLRGETEQWLRIAATSAETIATRATALGEAQVPVLVHVLRPFENSTAGGGNVRFVAERAGHLRDREPQSAHVVIQGQAIALGINPEAFPTAQAGKLLRALLQRLPGKGGGQGSLAQGMLKTAVTEISQIPAL